MAKIVEMPTNPLPVGDTQDFVLEYEVLYFTILKADRTEKKLTKLLSFKSVTPTTDITEQEFQLYSEKAARKLTTAIKKTFGTDGFLTKEKLPQEFIDIVDFAKMDNADTEYPLYRVLLYHQLVADKPVYMAHSYMANVAVSHIAPDGRLMQYHVDFNTKGEMVPVAIDLSDEEPTEPDED